MKPRHIISNALFLILFILVLIPSDDEVVFGGVFLGVLAATELAFLYFQIFKKSVAACDIAGVVYIVLLLWELATSKFIWVDRVMFPPPENVFDIFRKHGDRLFSDLLASLARLGVGFVSAVVAAVLLGILIGWFKPIKETVFPIIKIIAPIPSLVYVSYLIGVMPSFRVAAIAVIFLGVFFPNIIGIISAVSGIDKQITDSAKSLNVGKLTMLYRVLLPY
ncbi:MAG: hypothetical protein LBN42_00570, partial [Oscillospiraceae bacterium]|nr:hypothetical protein [Oscillospiraceae bacterium]